jgi:RNA polymerase sigma-70 factor (ECF subfamily)
MTKSDRGALFSEHRAFLVGLAYRMLGSLAEAEDAVQETFLRSEKAPRDDLASPRAWLATVLTRICLDQLKSARSTREHYTGPWLPEPVRTDLPDAVVKPKDLVEAETLSLAFLVLLETLSPLERAVFLLHEVFDYTHAEVAAILQRDEQAVRQLLHRARAHVKDGRPRFQTDPERHKELLLRFLSAVGAGDLAALESMLASDAVLKNDGGGKVHSALKPILGANRVARWFLGVRKKTPNTHVELAEINGQPGVILRDDRGPIGAFSLAVDESGQIAEIDVIVNPDKLGALGC